MKEQRMWIVPKGRLFGVPVPPETRTYKPVSHRELAKITLKSIKKAGFTVAKQEYSSAKEGKIANARYVIKELSDAEMTLEIGWQNSYDKTLSLKFAIGTRIFICDNGCVSGNFGAFKKKHMGEIKEFAPTQIEEAISGAAAQFARMKDERDAMKAIKITSRQQAELIGRLFLDEKIINSTQLNIIRAELNKPTYDYKAPNSMWELYQHTTYSMKNIHPSLWMDDHIKVHRFFNVECEELEEEILVTSDELE